jgi:hypothetical protein
MSFNDKSARAWLQANVVHHVPSGTRQYHTGVLSLALGENMLGLKVDRPTVKGTVIFVDADSSILKTARTRFTIIDNAILALPLNLGDTVSVQPYQRRRFDGSRFLDPVESETRDSGVTVKTFHIGGCASEIPLPAPHCEYLQNMLELLHYGKCTDGVRVISNLLVDAGARNLSWQEPGPAQNGGWLDPQFRFDCANGKFTGHVRVGLDCGEDTYYVQLERVDELGAHEVAHSCRSVYFDQLAEVLETLLCDGQWKFAKVEIHKTAKRPVLA